MLTYTPSARRMRAQAQAVWRRSPGRSVADVAADLFRTIAHSPPPPLPERAAKEVQISYFTSLANVALARVDWLRHSPHGRNMGTIAADLRNAIG